MSMPIKFEPVVLSVFTLVLSRLVVFSLLTLYEMDRIVVLSVYMY